jgi:hypothetical protein
VIFLFHITVIPGTGTVLCGFCILFKFWWAGHVARMARRGMHIGFWWESQKERDHKEDLDVGGRITLKSTLEKLDQVLWTRFI